MKEKKIFFALIIILIILIIILVFLKWKNNKKMSMQTEIIPAEEITEEQERQTIISLYFLDPESKNLIPEARKIDAKKLIENPYKLLVELLIDKPKNEKLISPIPEGTKVNNVILKNDLLEIDLSKEFIENQKGDIESAMQSIYSIVNTLTELNEVNSIKILIDGEENKQFDNISLSLKDVFVRKD